MDFVNFLSQTDSLAYESIHERSIQNLADQSYTCADFLIMTRAPLSAFEYLEDISNPGTFNGRLLRNACRVPSQDGVVRFLTNMVAEHHRHYDVGVGSVDTTGRTALMHAVMWGNRHVAPEDIIHLFRLAKKTLTHPAPMGGSGERATPMQYLLWYDFSTPVVSAAITVLHELLSGKLIEKCFCLEGMSDHHLDFDGGLLSDEAELSQAEQDQLASRRRKVFDRNFIGAILLIVPSCTWLSATKLPWTPSGLKTFLSYAIREPKLKTLELTSRLQIEVEADPTEDEEWTADSILESGTGAALTSSLKELILFIYESNIIYPAVVNEFASSFSLLETFEVSVQDGVPLNLMSDGLVTVVNRNTCLKRFKLEVEGVPNSNMSPLVESIANSRSLRIVDISLQPGEPNPVTERHRATECLAHRMRKQLIEYLEERNTMLTMVHVVSGSRVEGLCCHEVGCCGDENRKASQWKCNYLCFLNASGRSLLGPDNGTTKNLLRQLTRLNVFRSLRSVPAKHDTELALYSAGYMRLYHPLGFHDYQASARYGLLRSTIPLWCPQPRGRAMPQTGSKRKRSSP